MIIVTGVVSKNAHIPARQVRLFVRDGEPFGGRKVCRRKKAGLPRLLGVPFDSWRTLRLIAMVTSDYGHGKLKIHPIF
jgi:hypothetical protein